MQYTDDASEQLEFIFKQFGHYQKRFESQVPPAFAHVRQLLETEKPVFAAYMTGRFISEKDSVLQNSIYTPSSNAAFENRFERTIDYAATLSWFNHMDADEARAMRDSGQNTELPELKAVREALSKALLGQYERPSMRGSPPELIIYKKNTDLAYKVSQLSDGYRAMLALVMDLARRMAQAHAEDNPPYESPLHSPAIVLIDEVELHLHPSWQQTVLNTLMEIFPNTQFIVTTHSPQVLTAIPTKHIRVLSDGKAHTVSGQTEGAEASRLLHDIFGVAQRPQYLEIVEALNTYTQLVYEEQWDSPQAEVLRQRLAAHYGRDDPKLMELELHIENSKWERAL
jgi:predicted ATP-binding protein involved in virulence